jgi:tripartite ATP-independent transporter DctP family solute receptor
MPFSPLQMPAPEMPAAALPGAPLPFAPLTAAVLAVALSLAPGVAGGETLIRLAHTLNPGDARHLGAERFGELVAERSGGALRVEVFPSSQLGGQVEIFEGMNLGLIEMNIAGSTHLANLVPAFSVFDLPFLAPDVESFMALLDGPVGQQLLDMLPEVGLRGLAYSEVGFRHVYTNVPVTGIEDLAGLVIRVPGNPVYNDTLATFGARPTPMALGEVFTALQQGAIAGAENLVGFYRNSGHWEVAPHLALTYHAALPSVVMVSEVFWQRLIPELQQIVREAAVEAALFERALSMELEEQAMAELPGLGVTIHEVDTAPFIALAPGIHARHAASIGAELMEAIVAAMN